MLPLSLQAQPGNSSVIPADGLLMLFNQMQAQQDAINQLRGQIEVLQHQLQQETALSQQRYLDLEQRLSGKSNDDEPHNMVHDTEQQAINNGEIKAVKKDFDSIAQNQTRLKVQNTTNPSHQSIAVSPPITANNHTIDSNNSTHVASTDQQAAYAQALQSIKLHQLEQALTQLQTFQKNYPQSPLIPNIVYWQGEVLTAQSKLSAASQLFQQFIKKFPNSNKIPAATYKLALIYARQGKSNESIAILRKVIRQYPKSEAAQLAKKFLQSISG